MLPIMMAAALLLIRMSLTTSGAAAALPPATACTPPHDNLTFCNQSLTVAERAALLSELMTVEELISQMVDDMPPIPRLGVRQPYTYGIEALHGVAADCPWPGISGRCFTSFASASAQAASFNRSLFYAMGKAQGDEARWAYNHGYIGGIHLRGPQLNPQRDPRWGRNGIIIALLPTRCCLSEPGAAAAAAAAAAVIASAAAELQR